MFGYELIDGPDDSYEPVFVSPEWSEDGEGFLHLENLQIHYTKELTEKYVTVDLYKTLNSEEAYKIANGLLHSGPGFGDFEYLNSLGLFGWPMVKAVA
tara:strand:- start:152 stop:445 length:294 start_codon:yes stop_codon:yes gene_type:complete